MDTTEQDPKIPSEQGEKRAKERPPDPWGGLKVMSVEALFLVSTIAGTDDETIVRWITGASDLAARHR